jgi:hypothetical protein
LCPIIYDDDNFHSYFFIFKKNYYDECEAMMSGRMLPIFWRKQPAFSSQKMKMTGYSKMLVTIHQTTCPHVSLIITALRTSNVKIKYVPQFMTVQKQSQKNGD